jgi:hypothetical protein
LADADGQVLQQLWKQIGTNMEIEQVDQAAIPPRAFMRQFQLTPWRIIGTPDPNVQMFANFHTGSPVPIRNSTAYSRACPRHSGRREAHRGLLRDQPAD